MNTFLVRSGVTIATFAMVVTAIAPSAFAAKKVVKVKNNGKNSTNVAVVADVNLQAVKQTNNTAVLTGVVSGANTGGNTIKGTTGSTDSDPSITTGKVTQTTDVKVTGSSNTASLESCGCDPTGSEVVIKGNGQDSTNVAVVAAVDASLVSQKNNTFVGTMIVSGADTGNNTIKDSTGGEVGITSGAVTQTTDVKVTGTENTVQ